MQTGLRLYQAIIDQSQALGIDFETAAQLCGLSEWCLVNCFEEPDDPNRPNIYNILTRKRIEATSRFLGCSVFRIFLLADAFRWEDYRLIQATGLFKNKGPSQEKALASEAALYLRSVLSSAIIGSSEFIIEEFLASTWSTTLAQACSKTKVSYRKLLEWKNNISTPELSDLHEIRLISAAMDMGTPLVMACLGLIKWDDFLLDGNPVDIESELNAALAIEIW